MGTITPTDLSNGIGLAPTAEPVAARRACQSWINSFVEYTSILPSPAIFRKWAAIATLSGACERRIWSYSMGMMTYPNMFVLLVAPPAVGKSVVISQVDRLWRSTSKLRVASKTMTKAGLVDTLVDSRRVHNPNVPGKLPEEFHSLQVPSSEFGNLVPAYDLAFMNVLNELFDCEPRFSERLRSRGEELVIKNPQLTILAGTQPAYLTTLLPDEAWGQGFTTRTMMIYSTEKTLKPIFNGARFDDTLRQALEYDLIDMTGLYGEMRWSEEAQQAHNEWHMAGGPPTPKHARLEHYLGRRSMHVTKLSMIASLSRSSDLFVELQDFELALSWLLEAESFMPQIFRAMVMGGDSAVIHDAWQWALEEHDRTRKPLAERQLVNFLHQRIDAHNVLKTLETMEIAGYLDKIGNDAKGKPLYLPIKTQPLTPTFQEKNKKEDSSDE
jgi:hypothetical protein